MEFSFKPPPCVTISDFNTKLKKVHFDTKHNFFNALLFVNILLNLTIEVWLPSQIYFELRIKNVFQPK